MNYLAHLHIAEHCNSSYSGNILGDFVKGDPNMKYPEHIAEGIRLHRFVDRYIDEHELIQEAVEFFPKRQKRFSKIALDMFWDHCLAQNWHLYKTQSLENFAKEAYLILQKEQSGIMLNNDYLNVTKNMRDNNWLVAYRNFAIIEKALNKISQRSEKFAILKSCFPSLEQNYLKLNAIFFKLYPDILQTCKSRT